MFSWMALLNTIYYYELIIYHILLFFSFILRSNMRWCVLSFPGRFRSLSCRSFTADFWSCFRSRSSAMRRWTHCRGCTSSCPLTNMPERKRGSAHDLSLFLFLFFFAVAHTNYFHMVFHSGLLFKTWDISSHCLGLYL